MIVGGGWKRVLWLISERNPGLSRHFVDPDLRTRISPVTGSPALSLPQDKAHGIWVPALAPIGATTPATPGSTRPCFRSRWAGRCAFRVCAMRDTAGTPPKVRPLSTAPAPPSTRTAARASRASTSTLTKGISPAAAGLKSLQGFGVPAEAYGLANKRLHRASARPGRSVPRRRCNSLEWPRHRSVATG
jgi:hypothetical protein